ncbi:MAG: hypothetical protein E6G67_12920 [Actinobacteria bacterium]|nr:MAG: hypothetical protein E6G67_12920 [Actinomycetota bacterium]
MRILFIIMSVGLAMGLGLAAGAPAARAATTPPCTLYVSPAGTDSSPGTQQSDPTSLDTIRSKVVPGSNVCLLAGRYALSSTFYVTQSGETGSPIVYRAYGGTANLTWTGPSPAAGTSNAMIQVGNNTHDVGFVGLTLDGKDVVSTGYKCDSGASRLFVRLNTISNTGSGGIITRRCDYYALVRNKIFHTGYDPNVGWSSGISMNRNIWSDHFKGFHDFVVGNIISGATDDRRHTEGHGIIVDRGYNGPAVLVADNLVYENGGRCLDAYQSSHVWFVNNTCFRNTLDLQHPTRLSEITAKGVNNTDIHIVDNVAVAWRHRRPYGVDDDVTAYLARDVAWGGSPSAVPAAVADNPLLLRKVRPEFVNPPVVDPIADQQQRTAIPPWLIGSDLIPHLGSPLINNGIDPRKVAGVTDALKVGMNQYVVRDIQGVRRPVGGTWDIGAYER